MAAKEASGILLMTPGISIAVRISKTPCTIADNFVFPPAVIFAELLTITCVIGKPPKKPDKILPVPWANNSRFLGVRDLEGSNLSVASALNKVSILPTKAIINATPYTFGLPKIEKSGKTKKVEISLIE